MQVLGNSTTIDTTTKVKVKLQGNTTNQIGVIATAGLEVRRHLSNHLCIILVGIIVSILIQLCIESLGNTSRADIHNLRIK